MPIIRTLVEMIDYRKDLVDKGITYINDEKDEVFISYNQLYLRSLDILCLLQSKEIKPKQELVLQIEGNEELLYMFWACILGGIIPVPVTVGNNDEHRLKLFKIWEVLKAPYIVSSKKILDNLEKYADSHIELSDTFENMKNRFITYDKFVYTGKRGKIHASRDKDTAFVQFSSGSTGNSKGVILTNDNILTNIMAMKEGWGFRSEDVSLSWMPLTHDMGMIAFHLSSMLAGIQQYLMPTKLFINKPVLWISKANEHKATWIFSPNFGYMYFLAFYSPEINYGWDLSRIRYIINGAEPIVTELCDRFMEQLSVYRMKKVAMKAVYGLAEATVGVSFTPSDEEYRKVILDRRFLEVGQSVKLVEEGDNNALTFAEEGVFLNDCYVRICDNNGILVDDYVVGNIEISGRNVTSGYYNDPEGTKKVMTKDGWLKTGDLGFLANERLVCTGRAKDIIFINGQNYYPHDIERVAESFKGARFWDAAACGIFNCECNREDIVLFVVFKRKIEEFVKLSAQLKIHILECMGVYINHIIPVKTLPKTTSGKTQRYKLVEKYNNGEYTLLMGEIEQVDHKLNILYEENNILTATERNLLDIYIKVFGSRNISINDNFVDCGGNSIMLVQVSNEMEKLYPGRVTAVNLFAYPTIKLLAEFIDRNDNLIIPAVRVHEKYFVNAQSDSNIKSFEMVIDGELYNNLLKVGRSADVKVTDILLAMYIYLFKEISAENKIFVQVAVDLGQIISLKIDFKQIEDYESFFKLVASEITDIPHADIYSAKDSYRARFLKDAVSMVPLFYSRGMLSMDTNLIEVYDLALEIYEDNNRVELVCEFNNRRLDMQMVKELLQQYLWLIAEVVRNYAVKLE